MELTVQLRTEMSIRRLVCNTVRWGSEFCWRGTSLTWPREGWRRTDVEAWVSVGQTTCRCGTRRHWWGCSEPKGQQACSHPLQVGGSRMDSGSWGAQGPGAQGGRHGERLERARGLIRRTLKSGWVWGPWGTVAGFNQGAMWLGLGLEMPLLAAE